MSFNVERFKSSPFRDRTEGVKVPDLRWAFDEGAEPVWTVRGLRGPELFRAQEAITRNQNMEAMVAAIQAGSTKEKAEALQEMLGLGDELPDEYVKRLEMLIAGSVDPACDRELAVLVAENFPVEFALLTNAITRLTGLGRLAGERSGSGEIPASGSPSPSGTSTESASSS